MNDNKKNTLEDIKQLNDHSTISYILLFFIFIFQFTSKSKDVMTKVNEEQKKIGDKLFWKYLITIQISKAANWCLTPNYFDFFEKYHKMDYQTFSKFIAISFLSSSFLGTLIIGYLNDRKNKKLPCLIYGLIMIFCCLTRLIPNYFILIISQIFFGISVSILNTSFDNWFINECLNLLTDKDTRNSIITNAFEKNIICDSINAMIINFSLGLLKNEYGIFMPYMISVVISIIQILIVELLYDNNSNINEKEINENENKEEKEENKLEEINNDSLFKNSINASKIMLTNKLYFSIGLTESLIYIINQIFIYIWKPTLRSMNSHLNNKNVFVLFMISFIAGGTFFRVFYDYCNHNILKISKAIGFFFTLGFYLITFGIIYENKLFGFLVYEAGNGLFYPIYSTIKCDCIKSKYRGTLLNLFRIPSYLFIAYLYVKIKTWQVHDLRTFCFFVSLFIFLLQLIYFSENKKEEKKEEKKEVKKSKKKN